MKKYKIILAVCIGFLLQSCHKPGEIKIKNNISQVKLEDVKWGDVYMAYELLPGESSEKMKLRRYDKKLPATHKVTFKMTANNKTIYLETIDEYLLDEEDDLLIVLSDDTPVKNPNE